MTSNTWSMMKTIDITQFLSPDLKSRVRVHDLEMYIQNSGEKEVVLDFQHVKFATRSFIDEFYNVFLKNPDAHAYHVDITNVPEDINAIIETVSRTQTRAKVIPPQIPVVSFSSVSVMLKYLRTAAL